GTDEHAEKVVTAAAEHGATAVEWADLNAGRFREAFAEINCSHDDFIRTTEHRHKSRVLGYMRELLGTGDVYMGDYEGWFDPSQEEYVTEHAARKAEFKSPVTGKPLEKRTEKNYFFRLSKYGDRLREHIEAHGSFILPEARRNEVLGRIRQGLQDVPISRAITDESDAVQTWGIRMPGDDTHRIYVWIDALFNYLLARRLGEDVVRPLRFSAEAKSRLGFGLLAAVNGGRLKCYAADGSPEYATFRREMELARVGYLTGGRMTFHVDAADGHDDYLASLALAVEAGRDGIPQPRVARGRVPVLTR
ncbi:MAG: class I tRNA ligase family protein, partial [Chloroflexi bacterium]|nr:class I tRNA ligase family protein [Chloroflexota bacterium]